MDLSHSVFNFEGESPFVLLCDHAGNELPVQAGTLGLKPKMLRSHIAWDIGAFAVSKRIARTLDAPLVYQRFSRLFIDCNRPVDSMEIIPIESGGVKIPGNMHLSIEERRKRIDRYFRPYHEAIERLIQLRSRHMEAQYIVSVHSFTPRFAEQQRPWHIGVTYFSQNPLSRHLLSDLGRNKGVLLGDNEPYNVTMSTDFSIPEHAVKRDLSHVLIEIRQDLITKTEGQASYADILADSLAGFRARGKMANRSTNQRRIVDV